MPLLTKIPGKNYFISIFIIGAALFVTFSTVIYRQHDEAQRLNGWTLYNYEVVRLSRVILQSLVDMETGVRGYILTGQEDFLEPYEKSRKAVKDNIEQLLKYTEADSEARSNLEVWQQKIAAYDAMLSRKIQTFKEQGKAGVKDTILDDQKTQMDDLRILIEGYIQTQLRKLQQQIKISTEKRDNFNYVLTIGTILAISAMLLATLIITALIARAQRSAQAIIEAEERLRLVINGINDGVYDLNPVDKSIYYSPTFKSMLGYTDEEFPDSYDSANKILHPDDADATWEHFYQYERREIPEYRNIFRMRHKNGSWRWILSRGIGLWDKDGRMYRMIGTHMDITDQKKREEDLAHANADLENFTYITSHDMRSPLVNLKGFAKELEHSVNILSPVLYSVKHCLPEQDRDAVFGALEVDIPEALRFIEKATERLDTLTTAVLDLSRIGRREYRFEPVDMEAIVNKCIGAQAYEIEQKKAVVTVEPLPTLVSDGLALEQIFSNMLDNAVKYLSPERLGEIIISARQTATDVIFTIADNGRGIAIEDQRKIFEMFRRARNAEDVRGVGMGMSFVRATLRKLGGIIWCESSTGVGTKFYIRLPKQFMKERTV